LPAYCSLRGDSVQLNEHVIAAYRDCYAISRMRRMKKIIDVYNYAKTLNDDDLLNKIAYIRTVIYKQQPILLTNSLNELKRLMNSNKIFASLIYLAFMSFPGEKIDELMYSIFGKFEMQSRTLSLQQLVELKQNVWVAVNDFAASEKLQILPPIGKSVSLSSSQAQTTT
jgi:hypothetical protein